MITNYIDRSHDEEIINIMKSILDNGDWIVETINESILSKLMELRGTPIKHAKSFRNRTKDYKWWVEESKTT